MEPAIETYSHFYLKQIVQKVRQCINDPAQRREFEQWYSEQYGKEYKWNYPSNEVNGGENCG